MRGTGRAAGRRRATPVGTRRSWRRRARRARGCRPAPSPVAGRGRDRGPGRIHEQLRDVESKWEPHIGPVPFAPHHPRRDRHGDVQHRPHGAEHRARWCPRGLVDRRVPGPRAGIGRETADDRVRRRRRRSTARARRDRDCDRGSGSGVRTSRSPAQACPERRGRAERARRVVSAGDHGEALPAADGRGVGLLGVVPVDVPVGPALQHLVERDPALEARRARRRGRSAGRTRSSGGGRSLRWMSKRSPSGKWRSSRFAGAVEQHHDAALGAPSGRSTRRRA